jgi:hypothetical protein
MLSFGTTSLTATSLRAGTTSTSGQFLYSNLKELLCVDQCETNDSATAEVRARRLLNRTCFPNIYAFSDTFVNRSTDTTGGGYDITFPVTIDMNITANQKGTFVFTIYPTFTSTFVGDIARISSVVGVRRISIGYSATTSKFYFAVQDSAGLTTYTQMATVFDIRNKTVTICCEVDTTTAKLWCNGTYIGATTVKIMQANVDSVLVCLTGTPSLMYCYNCWFSYSSDGSDAQCLALSRLMAQSLGKYGLAAYNGTAKNFIDTSAHWIWADHLAVTGSTRTSCNFQVVLYFPTAVTVTIHALVAGSGTVIANGTSLGAITTYNSAGSTYTTYTVTTLAAADNTFQFSCSVPNTTTIAGLLACIRVGSTTIDVSRPGWRIV